MSSRLLPLVTEAVETFRVGLLITERCNISCSHCWFSSCPEKTSRMKLDEALGYIDQACEIPSLRWISFTGGEPFLLPEMLQQLVEYASEAGVETECVSNCFWASTEEKALKQLEKLKASGLDVINISADDFHQQHIPFQRVRNCYIAAKRLGLKVVIMSAAAKSSMLGVRKVVKSLGDERIRIVGEAAPWGSASNLAVETAFIPVGRAADIPQDEWIIGDGPLEGPCRVVLRDIAITPLGFVLPCSSASVLAKVAEVGNLKRDRLRRLLEDASRRRLFQMLSTEGPSGLQRLLGTSLSKKYVNRCHLCSDVLADLRLKKVL